jgi:5-methyltetrahydrofolate--homocysteine methyltransferase
MSSVQILDGAMGSMLFSAGLEPGKAPDQWNLTHPDEVRNVHRAYTHAGAQFATTNTFGSNPIRLAAMGLDDKVVELNQQAVRLAREGATGAVVAGDIGPSGEMLAPHGTLTREEAHESFAHQARILGAEGVDIFLLETFFSLEEALIAVDAVRDSSHKPIWASLTFRRTRRGFFTTYGDRPVQSLQSLLDHGAATVGANCTLSSKGMMALAEELTPRFGNTLFFQPNAGEPQIIDERVVYPETPEEFARHCAVMAQLGAGAIGGCCGSTPNHIRELSAIVRSNP